MQENFGDFAVMVAVAISIHLIYWIFNWCACQLMRLPLSEKKAVVIMTSEKTLPVAIVVVGIEAFDDRKSIRLELKSFQVLNFRAVTRSKSLHRINARTHQPHQQCHANALQYFIVVWLFVLCQYCKRMRSVSISSLHW